MPALVTHKFRQFNADQFYESLSESSPSYLYMFIGRIRAWGTESSPPTPLDALANTEYDFWRDMMSAKKISSSEATYCIPRKNWATTVVYNEYDPDNPNLFTSANGHYVMSADYRVYKCLFNNNGQGSTVEPSGTANTILTTGDKYKWKYMYSISAADALAFVTEDYIPVKNIGASDDGSLQWGIEQGASNGAIQIIDVTNGGTAFKGYNNGTLAAVSSNLSMTLASSANATGDFYNGSMLYITGGTGAGQQQEIVDYASGTKVVTLGAAFQTTPSTDSTYQVAPKVTITGDGAGCNAICTMNTTSNTVYSVTVKSIGQSYSQATVALTANGLTGALATAYIPPPGGHGNNAIKELAGYNIMLNAQFDKTESDKFTVSNDFRKLGLLIDPLTDAGAAATATRYDQTLQLTYSGNSAVWTADELVTGNTSGAIGYVVEANTTVLKLVSANGTFSATEVVDGSTSGNAGTLTAVANGELQLYSGELLYSEFRAPITRSSTQIEDIKLVINF